MFKGLFDCVKERKGYFVFLIILSVVSVVLGVIAAINFSGETYTINLSHIAYIKFLGGHCGFASMIFSLILSLLVFFIVLLICHLKIFLYPFGLIFYMYLVYSQTVVFMSVIITYGILNCIILAVLLLIYSLLVWCLFLFLMCEILKYFNKPNYFRSCCSFKESKILVYFLLMLLVTLIFALVLTILKSYVILLIF